MGLELCASMQTLARIITMLRRTLFQLLPFIQIVDLPMWGLRWKGKSGYWWLQDCGKDWAIWTLRFPKKKFLHKELRQVMDRFPFQDHEFVFIP